MLEPRPESRTPTRTRSAIVDGFPGLPSRPGAARAGDGAALNAGLDHAEGEDVLAGPFQRLRHVADLVRSDDQRHSDAAVEGSGHLPGLDIALRLEEGHQPRLL